jgi:PhnB protein
MTTTLTPYLFFAGNTREVFGFYEKALGAKIQAMMTYDQAPKSDQPAAEGCGGPAPTGDGIMHGSLVLPGGAPLFASDTPPGMPHEGVKGFMLAVTYGSVAEAEAAFKAMAEGGQVTMPMTPTFWAKSFGMLQDRYGVMWAFSGEPVPMN